MSASGPIAFREEVSDTVTDCQGLRERGRDTGQIRISHRDVIQYVITTVRNRDLVAESSTDDAGGGLGVRKAIAAGTRARWRASNQFLHTDLRRTLDQDCAASLV